MLRAIDPILCSLGRPIVRVYVYLMTLITMVRRSFAAALFEQSQGMRTVVRVLSAQIYFTGWQALPLISLLALTAGSVIIFNTANQSWLFGGEGVTTSVLYLVAFKELGPLLTALVVIARSGTAVASDLGTQKANREIDALKTMAIDPLGFVVFPRLVGGMVSVLALAFYFDFVAVIGGYFATTFFHNMPFATFWTSFCNQVSVADFALVTGKNIVNGFTIFAVGCHQGFQVKQSLHEVPKVTTQAVVVTTATVLVINLSLTILSQLSQLRALGVQ